MPKYGAGKNQFGVKRGDIRAIAKKDQDRSRLGPGTLADRRRRRAIPGNAHDQVEEFVRDEMDRKVRSVTFTEGADWLSSNVVSQYPDKESLGQKWMIAKDPMTARAGWRLRAESAQRRT
jgi:hypothetical protein